MNERDFDLHSSGGVVSAMSTRETATARWSGGALPANVRLGPGTVITGDRWTESQVFRKFESRLDPGLVIGAACRMDGVLFNIGEQGRVTIGDHCQFEEVFLISEQEIRIGSRVII